MNSEKELSLAVVKIYNKACKKLLQAYVPKGK
jgi:hypothetical protein